jgi:putative oxidoreductase
MRAILQRLQRTRPAVTVGVVRILLGLLFLMTGLMKILAPDLRAAFSGQLTASGLPFHDLNMWLVPVAEIGIGLLLLAGLLTRVASLMAIGMMVVATYVHLTVHDPALFPLQPQAPTIPLVVIVLCSWVLWAGAGSWSIDLRSTG